MLGSCIAQGPSVEAKELAKYKLYLVGVKEVKWDRGGMVGAGVIFFSMEKETKIINLEWDFWYTTE